MCLGELLVLAEGEKRGMLLSEFSKGQNDTDFFPLGTETGQLQGTVTKAGRSHASHEDRWFVHQ